MALLESHLRALRTSQSVATSADILRAFLSSSFMESDARQLCCEILVEYWDHLRSQVTIMDESHLKQIYLDETAPVHTMVGKHVRARPGMTTFNGITLGADDILEVQRRLEPHARSLAKIQRIFVSAAA